MVKSKASVLVHLGADDVGEVEGLLVILTVKDELKFPIRHLYTVMGAGLSEIFVDVDLGRD